MNSWGCAIDGCTDRIVMSSEETSGQENIIEFQAPACVIMPKKTTGYYQTGIDAQNSRICRGYLWPPESCFDPGNGIRRLPISLAWKLLVLADDQRASWKVSKNVQIPLVKPIAEHITQQLPDTLKHFVLATPNNLHEYGQSALISAIKRNGYDVTLLWRPVAAAIAWCDGLSNAEKTQVEDDDNLIVIHLGSDIFEFSSMRLKKKTHDDKEYVVPIRSRPKDNKIMSGVSLVASAAENLIYSLYGGEADPQAVWQVFSVFPDLWESVIKGDYTRVEDAVININETWEAWTPNGNIEKSLLSAHPKSEWLEKVVSDCSNLKNSNFMADRGDIVDIVTKRIKDVISECNKEKEIVGAVITGNMGHLPCGENKTLRDVAIYTLKEAGLNHDEWDRPVSTYIYSPKQSDNELIAKGCLIYQQRIENDLPTYLDTLPKLDIRAWVNYQHVWSPLVKAEEVEGGADYKNVLEKRFAVTPGQKELEFYLRREDADEFRKLPFSLPIEASEEIVLDMNVTMKPAQGFASVEIVPHKSKAFGAEHLYLDWSQMNPSPLSEDKIGIGYPETFNIESHPEVYKKLKNVFQRYLNTQVDSFIYERVIEELRDEVNKPTQVLIGNTWYPYRVVDENGFFPDGIDDTLGQKVLQKMDIDLNIILNQSRRLFVDTKLSCLRQAAAWLFAAAPDNVIEHLKNEIKMDRTKTQKDVVYGAGRSFTRHNDMALFFEVAIERIEESEAGTNVWTNSMSKILQHRENAPQCLTREDALFLARFAYKRMRNQLYKKNIKQIFKNSAHLFLYLLRWRTVGNFLSESSEYELGQDVKDILEDAAEISTRPYIKEVLEEIAKYIDFKGSKIIKGFPDE